MCIFHVTGTVHSPGCKQTLVTYNELLAETLPIKRAFHSIWSMWDTLANMSVASTDELVAQWITQETWS